MLDLGCCPSSCSICDAELLGGLIAPSDPAFAFEFPRTDKRDILENRLTVDWVIRY